MQLYHWCQAKIVTQEQQIASSHWCHCQLGAENTFITHCLQGLLLTLLICQTGMTYPIISYALKFSVDYKPSSLKLRRAWAKNLFRLPTFLTIIIIFILVVVFILLFILILIITAECVVRNVIDTNHRLQNIKQL